MWFKSEETKRKCDEARERGNLTSENKRLKRIEEYNKNPKFCLCCNKPIEYGKKREAKYCSRSCAGTVTNKKRIRIKRIKRIYLTCKYCGKEFIKKGAAKYCSFKCMGEHRTSIIVEMIENDNIVSKTSLRNYLMKKYNNSCQNCGWGIKNPISGTVCLDLHHKDGDFKNNRISNCEILCPNCHSLTNTYKHVDSKRKSTRIR